MILSNVSIHEALDKGWLILSPEPSPRLRTRIETYCPYQTSAVDLRLSDEITCFPDDLPINIDLRRGKFPALSGEIARTRTITNEQPFILEQNRMLLGRTLERVEFPIVEDGPSLAARIEGRSSYSRCGLLVHFTAPTIHAGFSGTITLEMVNLGPYHITLYPDAPICQLIIEQVHGKPIKNPSQFQGQSKAGGQAL